MGSENVIIINGQGFTYTRGETILQVAERHQIFIPTLCFLKGANPTGACRMCVVEIKGGKSLETACGTAASPNMEIQTESPRVIRSRQMTIELLLASGQHNCLVQELDINSWTDFQLKAMTLPDHKDICPAYGVCTLQDLAIRYRVKTKPFTPIQTPYPTENVNPFIIRDFSRCILCGRCVQACNEIQVNNAISFGYRGSASKIVAKGDLPLKNSDCVFCGECVQVCPVGALIIKNGQVPLATSLEEKKVRTTCSYCGVGCQLYLHIKDNRIQQVSGVADTGPNYGSLCVKGRFGNDFVHDPNRLKVPLIRENGQLKESSWEAAYEKIAEKFKKIKTESSPDVFMFLTSARITNEENYVAQKFARAVIGTNNVDHCARL